MSRNLVLMVVLLCLAASGCKFTRVETASRAQTEMIGMSKAAVLACMGAPAAKEAAEQIEVWSYPSGGDVDTFGTGTAYSSGSSVYGSGVASSKQRYCVVSIVMQNDIVTRVNYQGRTGGLLTEGEQCAFAVTNCVQD